MINTCTDIASTFDVCEGDINKLLKTVYKKEKNNFIILSMIGVKAKVKNLSFLPTITAHRKQGENTVNFISNHFRYDEFKKKYYLETDANLYGFEIDEKFKRIEDYIYHDKRDLVTDDIKEASTNFEFYVTFYAVTRIDGKYLIKELFLSE